VANDAVMCDRRRWLQHGVLSLPMLGLAAVGGQVKAAPSEGLPLSRSLPQELSAALAKHSPLVVMVSLQGCPHCHVARRSHLVPMYREGVPLVQVDMRSPLVTKHFNGQSVTHDQLVQEWRVSIAPTLLFFGPGGRELASRMEGSYLPDFYGAYLDDRIQSAQKQL
jgi:hypothetical protein